MTILRKSCYPFSRMPGPETPESRSPPVSPEPVLSRQDKERLLQKMYGLPHWIGIIRLFAYRTLTMEKARADIKPIAEKFGKEPTAEACEALVEIVPGKEPLARLKLHIKRMAFQILGPETKEAELPVPPLPPPKLCDMKPPSSSEGKPVKQPRHLVLKQCEAWLNESKLAFVAMKDVERTTSAATPFLGSLDFIVLRKEEKLLVTVRPHLQKKHVAAMAELQKLHGPEYRPVRLWPIDGPDGWYWQEYPVDTAGAST